MPSPTNPTKGRGAAPSERRSFSPGPGWDPLGPSLPRTARDERGGFSPNPGGPFYPRTVSGALLSKLPLSVPLLQENLVRDPTTSFLTATTLAYAIGAGITAAAGTRLALQSFLVKVFALFSFRLRYFFSKRRIVIYCHYLPVSGLGNLRACCLPWKW
jgi:hypothetical protein